MHLNYECVLLFGGGGSLRWVVSVVDLSAWDMNCVLGRMWKREGDFSVFLKTFVSRETPRMKERENSIFQKL